MFAICFFTDDLFQTGNGPQDQSTFVGSTVADKVDNIMDDIADAIVEQVDTIDMSDEKKAETREHLLAVFKTVANIN